MLAVLRGVAIAVSIVHYVDNTVRYDDYVQGASTPVGSVDGARRLVPVHGGRGRRTASLYRAPAATARRAGLLAFYAGERPHRPGGLPVDLAGGLRRRAEHVHRARHRAAATAILAFAVWTVVPPLRPAAPPISSAAVAAGSGGRSPSGRGQAIGVTSLAMGSPDRDAGAVDAKCGYAAPRVQPSAKKIIVCTRRTAVGGVGAGEVRGEPVVEGDRAARHLDEQGLASGDLGVGEEVLGLAEEDVDELAQPDLVRAGDVAHRAVARVDPSKGIHAVIVFGSAMGQ